MDMSKFAPSPTGVRKPTDTSKKNGMFWNPPRFAYFGGKAGAPQQAGTMGFSVAPGEGQRASGPITDRGKGRTK
jgi:hypothetical protein